ncbi:unnamed protein product (macronuclear) [Paramecium tetraurelia]|uniref:Kinesin-like protein n=1 Tax=Paramecium tetraurelia TaxID=5888 RepID=A0BPZ0_PARTE|nr:uncharacterized protein GSPATT00005358001 [Paramecium tetraurelia]CAK60607.1 unnamed protein product [Paramecium tetraurelia]|eukprot:XP_001428005.1 hypothetical protein (macronuclear) [Paramecium tetraurelia strain d4-2]
MKQKEKEGSNENLRVVIRVRPPMAREIKDGKFISTVQVAPDNQQLCIFDYHAIELVPDEELEAFVQNPANYTIHQFTFDYVYDQESTQVEVYETTAALSVDSTLQGYNSTIIAYGQTGTGKTYTMHGFSFTPNSDQLGIIPRSLHNIFTHIQMKSNSMTTFMVRASYLQIYNESISDLLRPDHQQLNIREDKKRGVFVENLSEWAVRSPPEIYQLMRRGNAKRVTASTRMNDTSSRSHAVFIITVEQIEETPDGKRARVGKLNLVDLAGSERVRVTGATGIRLEESKKINQSLSALGNVISALTELKQPKSHIPYRDSKITRLLEDSLGGNCKTTFMAMISPAIEAFSESLSTLKFANRAKNIRNTPMVNQDQDQGALLRKYQLEIQKLKQELDERSKMPIDSMVAELEKERQKALEDKQEVMSAYEQRNRDLVQEREMRKQLEEKISALNSQMLVGGQKIEETPQFQNALEKQQKIIRQQYQEKLQELEKERQNIEEDKAQTDKYKQLLLKQRDIMIALTNRLNERDETILQLQEELDAYEKLQKELEDINQTKESRIQQLVELLKQKDVEIPMNLDLPANSIINNAKQQLLLAEMPSSKMILVADPSSNSYIQTLPQQGSYHHSSEAVTQYELKNQIDINKKLELDLKISRMEQERQKKELGSLQEQIQKYENDTTTDQAKKSVDLILNQLTKPANGNSLATVAQELQRLQKILSEKEGSPKKAVQKFQQETSNLKQQEIINKLIIKPSKSNNQLNPPQSKKYKQKSVEELWN